MKYSIEELENIAWNDWVKFAKQQAKAGISLNQPSGTSPKITQHKDGRVTATFYNTDAALSVFLWNEQKECFEHSEKLTLQLKK